MILEARTASKMRSTLFTDCCSWVAAISAKCSSSFCSFGDGEDRATRAYMAYRRHGCGLLLAGMSRDAMKRGILIALPNKRMLLKNW